EDEQAAVTLAEDLRPAGQAVHVLLRGPRFPDAARLVRGAARIAAALDIDQQPQAAVAVDDEVEVLDARGAEVAAPALVDRDVAEAVALQVRLEGSLVAIAAVHRCNSWVQAGPPVMSEPEA